MAWLMGCNETEDAEEGYYVIERMSTEVDESAAAEITEWTCKEAIVAASRRDLKSFSCLLL